ncbi:unnamed protein product [Boreogadus saida]
MEKHDKETTNDPQTLKGRHSAAHNSPHKCLTSWAQRSAVTGGVKKTSRPPVQRGTGRRDKGLGREPRMSDGHDSLNKTLWLHLTCRPVKHGGGVQPVGVRVCTLLGCGSDMVHMKVPALRWLNSAEGGHSQRDRISCLNQ